MAVSRVPVVHAAAQAAVVFARRRIFQGRELRKRRARRHNKPSHRQSGDDESCLHCRRPFDSGIAASDAG